jgi:hypothetical protein
MINSSCGKKSWVGLDVVAVLHLVQPVRRLTTVVTLTVVAVTGCVNLASVGAGVMIDRQQRVHRTGDGDQGRSIRPLFAKSAIWPPTSENESLWT